MIEIEKDFKSVDIPKVLPMLPVRDIVIFPSMVLPLAVGREKSIKALEQAMTSTRHIFVVTQKNVQIEDPSPNDIYQIGTVCEVLQMLKMPDGTLKILVECVARAEWTEFKLTDRGYIEVGLNVFNEQIEKTAEVEAVMRRIIALFEQYVKLNPRMPMEISISVSNIQEPSRLADTIASHISIKNIEKQSILESINPLKRLNKIIQILNSEIEILNIEKRIQNRVRNQIEKNQKEYYLNEQMKAIQKELRQKDDNSKEIDELRTKIKASSMSDEEEKLQKKNCQEWKK